MSVIYLFVLDDWSVFRSEQLRGSDCWLRRHIFHSRYLSVSVRDRDNLLHLYKQKEYKFKLFSRNTLRKEFIRFLKVLLVDFFHIIFITIHLFTLLFLFICNTGTKKSSWGLLSVMPQTKTTYYCLPLHLQYC